MTRRCKCGKSQPSYNEPGKKPAICCLNCKTDTIVDITHKN